MIAFEDRGRIALGGQGGWFRADQGVTQISLYQERVLGFMSGHSKWATIKHKKGALDARRGKIFTKLIKEITVAARLGGGDPDANPRLRTAIAAAKAENMPADNIKRAIQKGTGELPGTSYEESVYEGYGPGGVAMMVEVATDNKNRTISEIRHIFSKNGGNLSESGSVAWMFQKKGYIVVEKEKADEEKLLNLVMETGAEDLNDDGSNWEIFTAVNDLQRVVERLKAENITPAVAEISMIPQSYVKLSGKSAQQVLRLSEELEDHDDVQHVYSNFDIEESELHALAEAK
jgi:YebC/PmpR family DNA-binding regulatory protein